MYADERALQQGRRLLGPGVVLENEVKRVILAGRVREGKHGAQVFGDSWLATVERRPGLLRPKPRAWVVTDLRTRQDI